MKYSKEVSKQPRKKRLALANLSLHQKRKLLSIHLGKTLRQQLKKRSMLAKKGDKVKVMTGDSKGKEGKIVGINTDNSRVFVEGIMVKRQQGREKPLPFNPSNLILLELEKRTEVRKSKRQEQ